MLHPTTRLISRCEISSRFRSYASYWSWPFSASPFLTASANGWSIWLADGGRPVSTAGYLAALGMVITMVGSLVLPVLATAARRVAILAGALAVGSVGVAALTVGGPGVFAAIAASSIGRVAVMPICMLFLMDHRDVGPRNIAVAGGLFFTAAQFGGVGGPYLTGLLADASGSFDLPVAVHASLLIALALYVVAAVPRAVRS